MSDQVVAPQPSYGLSTQLFNEAPRHGRPAAGPDGQQVGDQADQLIDDCGNVVGVRYRQEDQRERVTSFPADLQTSPLSMPAKRSSKG